MPTTRLVADVGGTNSRLGIFDQDSGEFRSVVSYSNSDFASFEDVIGCCMSFCRSIAANHVNLPTGNDRTAAHLPSATTFSVSASLRH